MMWRNPGPVLSIADEPVRVFPGPPPPIGVEGRLFAGVTKEHRESVRVDWEAMAWLSSLAVASVSGPVQHALGPIAKLRLTLPPGIVD